jgi:hypothetical protein
MAATAASRSEVDRDSKKSNPSDVANLLQNGNRQGLHKFRKMR